MARARIPHAKSITLLIQRLTCFILLVRRFGHRTTPSHRTDHAGSQNAMKLPPLFTVLLERRRIPTALIDVLAQISDEVNVRPNRVGTSHG